MVIGPTRRHRRDRPGSFRHFGKCHVTDNARLAVGARGAVDPNIDDGRAGLHPIAPHHLGPADSREQEIGATADRRQIARLGMCDRDRSVLVEQKLYQWLADDVGAADDDGFSPSSEPRTIFAR